MKKFVILIALISFSIFALADTITLNQALTGKLISCIFEGNGNSTHYLNPLKVTVQNNQNSINVVVIENGQQFESSDSAMQNLVIVRKEFIKVGPYQKKSMPLFAMCIQKHNSAPQSDIRYSKGNSSTGALLELTQFIEKNKYFDIAAQSAVWCLTDKSSIEEIAGFDTSEINNLQQLISKATGQLIPPKLAANDYRYNYHSPVNTVSYTGSFNYMVRKTSSVLIAMFDKDNRVVRELYRNDNEQTGAKSFKFEFDASTYKDDFYYIRLLVDGERRIEGKVDNR